MRCKVCNAYIPEGATYCLDCGSQFDDIILCQGCGAELQSVAKFCNRCGKSVVIPDDFKSPERKEQNGYTSPYGSIECQRCGVEVSRGTIYCPTCGTNVTKSGELVRAEGVTIVDSAPTEKTDDLKPCPRCGAEPRGSGRFCHNCGRYHGSDIEDVICPNCGATNILRYARCQYCGHELPPPLKI